VGLLELVKARLEEQTPASRVWPLWKTCGRTVQTLWTPRGMSFFRRRKSSKSPPEPVEALAFVPTFACFA